MTHARPARATAGSGAPPTGRPEPWALAYRFWRFQGPVMASMMPGVWMLA